jgi:hypothetical protein
MSTFGQSENQRLANLKQSSPYFSSQARVDGVYRGKPRPFCLPRASARENLFPEIRESATAYFSAHEIKWHDGRDGDPSNHLRDGQVMCVNLLFPFADKPQALAELLRPLFPAIRRLLPMEEPGAFVSFEWIGHQNYLGERIARDGKRTRGANFTSADAAVMFEREDGRRQITLIEWKYTESYSATSFRIAKSGTDRTAIYRHLYQREDFPLDKGLLPSFDALFYEPFYQLLRQQMLAHEMEKAGELGAQVVTYLHIAPAHNRALRRITSPELRSLGESAIDVWKRLVKTRDRFISISTEDLFGAFPVRRFPELRSWWDYIAARYPWVLPAL